MACNRPDPRSPSARPGCIDPPPTRDGPRKALRVSKEAIVREAIARVEADNLGAFDAADWAAAHYNYVDLEAILQRVRDGVDHA